MYGRGAHSRDGGRMPRGLRDQQDFNVFLEAELRRTRVENEWLERGLEERHQQWSRGGASTCAPQARAVRPPHGAYGGVPDGGTDPVTQRGGVPPAPHAAAVAATPLAKGHSPRGAGAPHRDKRGSEGSDSASTLSPSTPPLDSDVDIGSVYSDSSGERAVRAKLREQAVVAAAAVQCNAVRDPRGTAPDPTAAARPAHADPTNGGSGPRRGDRHPPKAAQAKAVTALAALVRATSQRRHESVTCYLNGAQVHKAEYSGYLARLEARLRHSDIVADGAPVHRPVRAPPTAVTPATEVHAYNQEAIAMYKTFWHAHADALRDV